MKWKNSKVGTNLGVIIPSKANVNGLQDILSRVLELLRKKYSIISKAASEKEMFGSI